MKVVPFGFALLTLLATPVLVSSEAAARVKHPHATIEHFKPTPKGARIAGGMAIAARSAGGSIPAPAGDSASADQQQSLIIQILGVPS
jgi:hypothetical protein